MGCYKRGKTGDLVSWPCGKKEDGHIFGHGIASGSKRARLQSETRAETKERKEGYKEKKKERKETKKHYKKLDKHYKKNPDAPR